MTRKRHCGIIKDIKNFEIWLENEKNMGMGMGEVL